MAGIKQLAGQTIWYGLSSIVARFINYLLTPFLTYSAVISTADFGKMGLIYSAIPILNVLFTYGFETAYFRFSNENKQQPNLYSTSLISLISTTVLFSLLLFSFQSTIANLTGLANYPQMVQWAIAIIALDTICVLPFAKLRQEGRPVKFAFIKVAGIVINVFFTWFFVGYCPFHLQEFWINSWYNTQTNPIIYVLFANFLQALFTLVLLLPALIKIKWQFNWVLWKEMMVYALPLIIVGLGGIVNETFDRLMLRAWLPGIEEYKQEQVGIYNACYKLSILITLFIQAFKMGAEPFFFKQAQGLQPQKVYARVMKFFVLTILVMFLVVSMFMPIWQYFIGPAYRVGLGIVPILLLANMFLGVYYNLSIWYKLGKNTMAGTYITLIGCVITCLINWFGIPVWGYWACAWATFFCYGGMMVISYVWGQKTYPVPYPIKTMLFYFAVALTIFFIYSILKIFVVHQYFQITMAVVLIMSYLLLIVKLERAEISRLPILNRIFK